MTNTLLIKRSSVPGSVPAAGNLELGELALNYQDGNLFYKNSANAVTVLASNQFVSVSGNVTAGNIVTGGLISATGNITANYFIGNGSLLTGVGGSGNSITNGNSNIRISTANGNATVAIAGLDTSSLFTRGSFFTAGPLATPKLIDHTSLVTDNVNSVLYGTVTIGANGNVYVPSTSTLTIGADLGNRIVFGNSSVGIATANGNVAVAVAGTANVMVISDNAVVTTANITAPYFIGNGSLLTGIAGGGGGGASISNGTSNVNIAAVNGNVTVSVGGTANVVTVTSVGANISGTVAVSGNISAGNVQATDIQVSGLSNLATINLSGSIIPTANVTYNLGNSTNRFNDLWLANSTIYLGAAQISANATAIVLTNPAGGNMTLAGATSDISANIISVSGNVTGGNILTAGLLSATANVTGGNILTAGLLSAAGNVTANYFIGNGSLLTGIAGGGGGGASISNGTSNVNIATSDGNVTTSVAGTANVLVVTGTGANVAGTVSASGNVTANYFIGNGSQLTGTGITAGRSIVFAMVFGR